jgi:hypothetical protein
VLARLVLWLIYGKDRRQEHLPDDNTYRPIMEAKRDSGQSSRATISQNSPDNFIAFNLVDNISGELRGLVECFSWSASSKKPTFCGKTILHNINYAYFVGWEIFPPFIRLLLPY